jgi:hypothetical protein
MKKLFVFVAALVAGLTISVVAIASRNSSGTYSLPSGNPVVSGTTISSTVHNNTMSDLATEVTDSLSRSNKGAMLGNLELVAGADTCASPALTWDGDEDSGFIRSAADTLGICTGGSSRVAISSTGVSVTGTTTSSGQFLGAVSPDIGGGAYLVATGGYAFTGDTNTGLFNGIADTVYLAANGTAVLSCTSSICNPGVAFRPTTFTSATSATDVARQTAATLSNGDLDMSSVVNPASTAGFTEKLTPANIPKAFAAVRLSNATPYVPSVDSGFNIASVSRIDTNTLRVTIADDMADANGGSAGAGYSAVCTVNGANRYCFTTSKATTHVDIQTADATGATAMDGHGASDFVISVNIFGLQ